MAGRQTDWEGKERRVEKQMEEEGGKEKRGKERKAGQ